MNAGSKLTEALASSPICRGEDGAIIGGGMDFGNMEEDDPELALALRVSLEEQRQRQQREGGEEVQAPQGMEVDNAAQQEGAAPAEAKRAEPSQQKDLSEMTEDEQIAFALQMSLQNEEPGKSRSRSQLALAAEGMEVEQNPAEQGVGNLLDDTERLQQLVDQLPDGEKDAEKSKDKKESK